MNRNKNVNSQSFNEKRIYNKKQHILMKDHIFKTYSIGADRWKESTCFDDYDLIPNLEDYKIFKIKIWYGHGFSPIPPDINGIKFYFKHMGNNTIVETEDRMGQDSMDGFHEFTLNDNEFIQDISIRSGWIIDCLTFKLNNGRLIKVGGQGGQEGNFKMQNKSVFIGSFGKFGTNLYDIGFYYTTIENYLLKRFRLRKLPFMLIKAKFKENKLDICKIIKYLETENNNYPNKYASEIAFGKLCLLKNENIFSFVMSLVN